MRNKKLILEFTEFNLQRFNNDSAVMATHVDNPQLSINNFDRHEEILKNTIRKLKDIAGGSNLLYRTIKSNLIIEGQELEDLVIMKIVKSLGVNYDVYIRFKIKDREYWGVIIDVLNKVDFKYEELDKHDLLVTKEWCIRMEGKVINSVRDFLKVEKGFWKNLKEIKIISSLDGSEKFLQPGTIIRVIKSYDDRIFIEYNNLKYILRGDNFIYFNWWMEKKE